MYESFTTDGVINDSGRDSIHVKQGFLDNFDKRKEPLDIIRKARETVLDLQALVTARHCLDSVYNQAGFNEQAKYGFLCIAVMNIPDVATLVMYAVHLVMWNWVTKLKTSRIQ